MILRSEDSWLESENFTLSDQEEQWPAMSARARPQCAAYTSQQRAAIPFLNSRRGSHFPQQPVQ